MADKTENVKNSASENLSTSSLPESPAAGVSANPGHKNPNVTRAVKPSESGSFSARGDAKKGFYFNLICGHRSPTKTRKKWGEIVTSPDKAEWRPCEECKQALLAAGKPLPPCPLCKGAGEMRNERHTISRGQHVASFSIARCPACHGKTTNPSGVAKPDLRDVFPAPRSRESDPRALRDPRSDPRQGDEVEAADQASRRCVEFRGNDRLRSDPEGGFVAFRQPEWAGLKERMTTLGEWRAWAKDGRVVFVNDPRGGP